MATGCCEEISRSSPSSGIFSPARARPGCMLQPLTFPEVREADSSHFIYPERDVPIVCLFRSCEEVFGRQSSSPNSLRPSDPYEENEKIYPASSELLKLTSKEFKTNCSLVSRPVEDLEEGGNPEEQKEPELLTRQFSVKDEWLRHLFLKHKMVVDNVDGICSLRSYSEYWRRRFSEAPITDFAVVIRTNSAVEDSCVPSEDFYLLSDVLPEDRELRTRLKLQKLEAILRVNERERRDDGFSHGCLFCSQVFAGNRTRLFQHMLDSHGLNLGHPDNLVFVKEFLDVLQQKLDNLQCLYCEKTFRDHSTLKDHMRKKQHKKIDGRNRVYDKFYLINYLEPGKTWEEVLSEDDQDVSPQSHDSDWEDWKEPNTDTLVFCLFCSHSFPSLAPVLEHMQESHGFNYQQSVKDAGTDYYGQVKMVNYIRRQMYVRICCYCHERFTSQDSLTAHMATEDHCRLPLSETDPVKNRPWNQPQFYFPTYENDGFLFALEDS